MGTTESIFYEEEEKPQPPERRSTTRPSPPPPSATAKALAVKPLLRLSGVILGLPQSGRKSLLQRLLGKNPSPLVSIDSAVAPYQAPRGHPTWDRIQLSVRIAKPKESMDFAVIMVDPRHDRDRIEAYLTGAIETLLHCQGYSESRQELKRPFCLCLLLNFYDQRRKFSPDELLEESDVQHMTLCALQDAQVEPSLLHLQIASTSLYDCYGLSILHHFIYQSYLLQKQWSLQQTLGQVHRARSQSVPPEILPYQEYLKVLKNPETIRAAEMGSVGSGHSREISDNDNVSVDDRKNKKKKKKEPRRKVERRRIIPDSEPTIEPAKEPAMEPPVEPPPTPTFIPLSLQ